MVIAPPTLVKRAPTRRNAVQASPQPPTTKKGWERRTKLKKAMATLLEAQSYHGIRIADIAKKAGIPASVFYHYFRSKEDLTVELLNEMSITFETRVRAGAPHSQHYDGILSFARAIFELYEENVGLIRALVELDEQSLAQQWESLTLHWQHYVAQSLEDDIDPAHRDHNMSLATAYALSGMCNSYAHAYFVTRTPALREAFPNPADAATYVAQLGYRAVRLTNPSSEVSPFLEHLRAYRP